MARYVNRGDPLLTNRRVYFDIRQTDGVSPANGEAGNQPQVSINGGSWTPTGIGTLTLIGFGRYYADLDISTISGNVGDVIETRYKGAATIETPGDSFQVSGSIPAPAPVIAVTPTNSYGGLIDAAAYFSNRMNSSAWDDSDDVTRQKALNHATMLIDRLNFAGDKADPNQVLQFPRGDTVVKIDITTGLPGTPVVTNDSTIPQDIRRACYEIAIQLLDGIDPDMEVMNLATTSHGISSVRSTYDRQFVEEHVRAGIPSFTAWSYLRPYLRDSQEITLSRVS